MDSFQQTVLRYYRKHKRNLPWRRTIDPYHILISEVMLQQTQVSRVLLKYGLFLARFPDFHSLAKAPLKEILRIWQGLGYSRRALYLKRSAEIVVKKYKGILSQDPKIMKTLPGIGEVTADSIAAFAFQKATVFIETNIRRTFIHFFFKDRQNVDDKEIRPLIRQTLDKKNPREWYYALMDYGAKLSKETVNPNRRSRQYRKQSSFNGSDRQIRGVILRILLQKGSMAEKQLISSKSFSKERILKNIERLQKEGFLTKRGGRYFIQ